MANQPQQPDTALHNASHLMQYHDLIESIVAALDARDAYTASHSDRVADMVLVLAAALGLDEDETTRIHMAAHLHDIGKIAVPDSVLRKAGPLTRPEWEEMRRHPVTGYEILRKIDDFKEIAILVRHHHERWDSRGYPDGLSGHDIPPGSRVIAVADSIDAMMSSRSYRPAMTSAACRREIEKNSGIMYDPRVAAAALEHWDELVSRYAGADTPRTHYFDRLQLEHTRQAHDYLLTHQGSRITLPDLAAKFHLSQSSLKICFKALYGVPVASYLRGLRMDTAARLLQESDLPVAEEAALTAEFLGNRVERVRDVGVAGLHRLLAHADQLAHAQVIVAVAGMEGALASVIGGLVSCPVIAVPTSVGYGANLGGLSALLSMLNSCASGVSVVNIDNGFGAGYQASLINHLPGRVPAQTNDARPADAQR